MNVKQGDLAFTFGAPMDNGLLVEVLERYHDGRTRSEFGPCWHIRSLGSQFHITPFRQAQEAVWPDKMLRRIDNPPDDAKDQSLEWLPVPLPELV